MSDEQNTVKAPERLTKQVCPDGFIDCRAHPASSFREVEYVRVDLAPVAQPRTNVAEEPHPGYDCAGTCVTCGGSREIVIGCAVGHPLTAPCPECSAKSTQMAANKDASQWVKNKLRPEHRCKPLARALMTEGRDWWIGELLEPVADWPNETHCLHMKTPLKDVSFLCNAGDFEQLLVLSNVIVKLENLTWLRATTAGAKARLLPPFTKTEGDGR